MAAAELLALATRPLVFDFNPDQPRDDHGRWTDDGGGGGGSTNDSTQPVTSTAPVKAQEAQFNTLKDHWADLDHQLGQYAGDPDDPRAQAIIKEQIDTQEQMHALDIDEGAAQGMGEPGGPRDVVVVGAGPAGLQASIYGGAEGMDTLMVDKNGEPGGQIGLTSRTENVLGFPAGVTGAEYAQDGLQQAQRLGADTKLGVGVTGMTYDSDTGLKTLTMDDGSTVDARSVVIAGGVQFNTLNVPGADSDSVVYGNGQALKDAGGPVTMVGGGNSAGQAAVYVASDSQPVTMLMRGDEGSINDSMSSYLTNQIENNPNITVKYNSEIATVNTNDDGSANSVTLKDGTEIPTSSVGVFIGSSPQTDWATGVARDDHGYILTGAQGAASALETSIPGVYAAGDVRSGSLHRVVAAAGDGGVAVSTAYQYVNKTFFQGGSQTAAATPPEPFKPKRPLKDYPGNDYMAKMVALDKIEPYTGFDPTAPKVPGLSLRASVRYGATR